MSILMPPLFFCTSLMHFASLQTVQRSRSNPNKHRAVLLPALLKVEMCNFPNMHRAWANLLLILLGCNSEDILKCGGGKWRVFQVFLNRCPVQVRPFPPNSRTSPLSASVEASVPREQVLRAQGAHARTHTHARLQLPLGFCVTCGCLTPPPPPRMDPFRGGSMTGGAPFTGTPQYRAP